MDTRFNENNLKLIAGGKQDMDTSSSRKETAIFCFYKDSSDRKAIFCEAKKNTVIFTFYSPAVRKYTTLTLDTNKRFHKISAKDIPHEWEKTAFIEGDIGPSKYGRCFLSNSYNEAVRQTFLALEHLLTKKEDSMPDHEIAICVQAFLPLLQDKTKKEIMGTALNSL